MKGEREGNSNIINQDNDNNSTDSNALDVSIEKLRNKKAAELVSRYGELALHVSIEIGNNEIAKLLIDTDSSTDSSITHSLLTAKANNGVTALQYARQNRKIEATKFLNEVTELQTSILKLFKSGCIYQDYKKLFEAFTNNSFAKNVFIKALSSKVDKAIVEGIETTQRLLTLIHRNIKEAKLFELQSDMIKEILEYSVDSKQLNFS